MAVEAEDAGIDGVMLSEHIVLGPSAGAGGRPANPRDYAAPGNQDPDTPWPDSIVLMSAIAAVTTRLRLIGAAIIAPLRHPVLLAHQLATLDLLCEGRLVVQPTVSWHREEYAALGVPFERRGELLDEHLAAWKALWRPGPVSFDGRWYSFADVYLEPKPFRAAGPRLWFGGMTVGPWIVRRLVEYGHGFHPFGQPDASELRVLVDAMAAAGRDFGELEVVGGIRGRFPCGGRGCRPRRGGGGDPGAARGRLHDDLLQALAVHRLGVGRGAAVSRARRRQSAAENSAVRSTTVFTSE